MQKPSLGRIVLVNTGPLGLANDDNGAETAPAIITRVWSDTLVNVRVLLDSEHTPCKTSVALVETAEEAEASYACYWPPRV
jgi:hypothetical protein